MTDTVRKQLITDCLADSSDDNYIHSSHVQKRITKSHNTSCLLKSSATLSKSKNQKGHLNKGVFAYPFTTLPLVGKFSFFVSSPRFKTVCQNGTTAKNRDKKK